MAAAPIIVAEGVSKKFGDNQVLTRVTLPVMERDVVCIVGPSGSGKTTLLRCLALLETPSEGRIVMEGATISTPSTLFFRLLSSVERGALAPTKTRK